jgi:hypothetical protein
MSIKEPKGIKDFLLIVALIIIGGIVLSLL